MTFLTTVSDLHCTDITADVGAGVGSPVFPEAQESWFGVQ